MCDEPSLLSPDQHTAFREVVHGENSSRVGLAGALDGDRAVHVMREEQSLLSPDQHTPEF